jgi:hypothetical protein
VAAGSLKVFALLVEAVEVGCGRPGAVRLLHFDAARVDLLAAAVPWDEPGWEGGFTGRRHPGQLSVSDQR